MTYQMNVNWTTDHLLRNALQHEMQNRWKQQIFMCEKGYGKDYWSDELDILADMLLEQQRASREYTKEALKELGF